MLVQLFKLTFSGKYFSGHILSAVKALPPSCHTFHPWFHELPFQRNSWWFIRVKWCLWPNEFCSRKWYFSQRLIYKNYFFFHKLYFDYSSFLCIKSTEMHHVFLCREIWRGFCNKQVKKLLVQDCWIAEVWYLFLTLCPIQLASVHWCGSLILRVHSLFPRPSFRCGFFSEMESLVHTHICIYLYVHPHTQISCVNNPSVWPEKYQVKMDMPVSQESGNGT